MLLKHMSERECARFRNRNLRQPGAQRRVHEVELRDWVGGLKLPGPACHQPLDAFALAGSSEAVTAPVDCAKCLSRNPDPFTPLTVVDGGQLTLDLRGGDCPQARRPDASRSAHDHRAPNDSVEETSCPTTPLSPGDGQAASSRTGSAVAYAGLRTCESALVRMSEGSCAADHR